MFTRRYKKCYCMNNNVCDTNNNLIEDKCDDVCPCAYEECEKEVKDFLHNMHHANLVMIHA